MEANRILYEDNHLIAVHKKAGQMVQAEYEGADALETEVKAYIKTKYKKPGAVYLGIIHRLDRPVSGLVLMAKTSKALTRMNKLFKDRKITKTYYALVDNKPTKLAAELSHYLTKDTSKNIAKAHNKEVKGSKKALMSYEYISTANHKHLIRVQPTTGRPHQIRVQLAKSCAPIVGDLKYGAKRGRDEMIYLHAWSLEFLHPVKQEKLHLHCPLPTDVNWNFFKEFTVK